MDRESSERIRDTPFTAFADDGNLTTDEGNGSLAEKPLSSVNATSCPNTSPTRTQSSTAKQQRFIFVSDENLSVMSKGVVPVNTDKSTRWALSNFEAWKTARNEQHPNDPVPDDLLMCTDPATLNTHLSRFVLERRMARLKLCISSFAAY